MLVNSVPIAASSLPKSRIRKTGTGGFANYLDGDLANQQVQDGAALQHAAPISSLYALQEVEDPFVGRKKIIQTSHLILDELESLKIDLLSGQISSERFKKIKSLLEQYKHAKDPDLVSLVAEIELRAAVELAKLERF